MAQKNARTKPQLKQGLIRYIYGTGPGKTTSAFGLLLRTIGHGLEPTVIQFLKKSSGKYARGTKAEIEEIKKLEEIAGISLSDLIEKYYGNEEHNDLNQSDNDTEEGENKTKRKKSAGFEYGEFYTLTRVLKVPVIQLGTSKFVFSEKDITDEHLKRAELGLELLKRLVDSNSNIDVIVLDEINIAVQLNMINTQDLIKILKERSANKEVILTGRPGIKDLMEISDYVIRIQEEKHPYQKAIIARKGIEF
ncbi:MAG: cob(I)yrinic acid a,c-diamide adenosyltransferase [Promethearchaeota archaeon]